MTSLQDSEILTRVGPGTPMGNLMRHYWFPALKSSELKADGDPVRFLLLGEKLIAFRDSAGRVGGIPAPPPVAPLCSSAGTSKAGFVASITAGNTTSPASASTSRTCPRAR